jgi:hypothetical protein
MSIVIRYLRLSAVPTVLAYLSGFVGDHKLK